MTCCGGEGRLETGKIFSTVPVFIWVHLCSIMDLRLLRYKVFVNGKMFQGPIVSTGNNGLSIEGEGIAILGQEQDLYGGGFTVQQSFEGILAGYMIAFGVSNDEAVQKFMRCENNGIEDVLISFDNFPQGWSTNGSVEVLSVEAAEVCQEKQTEYIIFPTPRSLDNSVKMCRKLKGEISVPKNAAENEKITEIAAGKLPQCTAGWGVSLWIGAKGVRDENDMWVYKSIINNAQLNYTNFKAGYAIPVSSHYCLYLDSFEVKYWVQSPCIFKTCVICEFNSPTVLRLRGLCEDSIIDRYYVINGEYNGQPLFKGISHSIIRATNTTWELVDTLFPSTNATMIVTERNQNPVGLREWKVFGDKCEDTSPKLLLTACQAHQYTCNDGTCIEKMQRCDLQVNCPDQSDERLCIPVVVSEDYIQEVRI